MRHRLVIAAAATAVAAVLALTGCAPTAAPTGRKASSTPISTAAPTSPATTAPAPTVKPTPTTKPAAAGAIVVGPTKIAYTTGGTTTSADLSKGKDVVALFSKAAGTTPAGKKESSDYGTFTTYDFGDVIVTVADSDYANVRVMSPKVNGTAIRTADGFQVGSMRKDLMAAGAQDGFDADGDGLADELRMGIQKAPGTTSLENPGATGIDYVMLVMDGNTVKTIMVPANDYSDL